MRSFEYRVRHLQENEKNVLLSIFELPNTRRERMLVVAAVVKTEKLCKSNWLTRMAEVPVIYSAFCKPRKLVPRGPNGFSVYSSAAHKSHCYIVCIESPTCRWLCLLASRGQFNTPRANPGSGAPSNTLLYYGFKQHKRRLCLKQVFVVIVTDVARRQAVQNYARSQPSAEAELNSSVFWVLRRRKVAWNRRFGITYYSHLNGQAVFFLDSLTLENGTGR